MLKTDAVPRREKMISDLMVILSGKGAWRIWLCLAFLELLITVTVRK